MWKPFKGTRYSAAQFISVENNNAGGLTEFKIWPMIKHKPSSNVITRVPNLRHDQNTLMIDNAACVYSEFGTVIASVV